MRSPLRRWLLLAALTVVAAGFVAWRVVRPPAARKPPNFDDWDVPRLLRELRARGLDVRCVPDLELPADAHADYRTLTGGSTFVEAARVVYVTADGLERMPDRPIPLRDSPEVGRLGRFHFYGDPDLFNRIAAALDY